MKNNDYYFKISEIYDWLMTKNGGVSNDEVKQHFQGEGYSKAWERLKRKKDFVFYENGLWHSWYLKK